MNMIAFLNEEFRRTFHGGKVMMTMGVAELPERVVAEALVRVANFSRFTSETIDMASTTSGASSSWVGSSSGRSTTTMKICGTAQKIRAIRSEPCVCSR